MSEQSFFEFVNYLRSCQLEELDLRDSRVTADQFLNMFDVLKGNRKLKWLNLAHNNLVSLAVPCKIKSNNGNASGLDTIDEE